MPWFTSKGARSIERHGGAAFRDALGGEFPDDFNPIRANFRKNVGAHTDGDLVPNGIVDFADFDQWKTAFLGGGGSLANIDFSFLAGVPEPSSALLLLVAGGMLMLGRRRN